MLRRQLLIVVSLAVAFGCGVAETIAADSGAVSKELREQAVARLREAMNTQPRWVKVHAAEYLLALDYPEGVWEAFLAEEKANGQEPQYRVGIWRVLAKSSNEPAQREKWVNTIRQAFLDPASPDRPHAVETLAKIGYEVPPAERPAFEVFIRENTDREGALTRWAMAGSADPTDRDKLAAYLNSENATARLIAAIAFQKMGNVKPEIWQKIAAAARKEPTSSPSRVYLLASAYATAPSADQAAEFHAPLAECLGKDSADDRKFAASGFAQRGDMNDLPLLNPLLNDADADVRVFAANAILRVERRVPRSLHLLDWGVLALYFAGMLAIGWYYSRQTSNTEEYLLGGRNMKPWAVGLSLFATLLSTLSYMAFPGEMILHGPMIAAGYLSYPLVFLVVGYLLIPFIMRLHAVSAYELLEKRLGLGVRMTGSGVFLLIRLIWMGAIIYVTSAVILVPVMGIDRSWVPLVSAVIGLVTLIYTSMGGIKAVVVTDVVQTFILLGGALVAIILISVHFGGFGWFPTHWSPNWDPPVIWFSADARTTMAGALVLVFGWYVCTAGSDQLAIQRYLATRDAKSARGVLGMSLAAGVLVVVLLLILGLALLAFFRANPQLIPDGKTIQTGADQLFSRYIVYGLPAGLTGLVISALLAAAMSSLSAGVNSSCSVITADFIDRFSKRKVTDSSQVRRARLISVAIGIIMVLLSLCVDQVKGNLFEMAQKLCGLLTAPLFLLFFMALFIPWARGLATIVGTAASVATAVAIANYEVFGLSFIWIIPCSLGAGVMVGCILSLFPIGPTVRGRLARCEKKTEHIKGTDHGIQH